MRIMHRALYRSSLVLYFGRTADASGLACSRIGPNNTPQAALLAASIHQSLALEQRRWQHGRNGRGWKAGMTDRRRRFRPKTTLPGRASHPETTLRMNPKSDVPFLRDITGALSADLQHDAESSAQTDTKTEKAESVRPEADHDAVRPEADHDAGQAEAGGSPHVGQQRASESPVGGSMEGITVAPLEGGEFQLSSHRSIQTSAVWAGARLIRQSARYRRVVNTCVVGGLDAVHAIWRRHGVHPTMLFAPEGSPIPTWFASDAEGETTRRPPIRVIEAPYNQINSELLSAERNDGYAAEFPLPPLPPLTDLVESPWSRAMAKGEGGVAEQKSKEATRPVRFSRVAVLHRVRIPSNVGALLRAAEANGYDAVVLNECCDVYSEKVLREANGVPYSSKIRIYEISSKDAYRSVTILQHLAAAHNLLPVFAVPSQDAEHVFRFSSRFHQQVAKEEAEIQSQSGKGKPSSDADTTKPPLGAMVLLGGEGYGFEELARQWQLPRKDVTIVIDDPLTDSLNVALAGGIILHHFRPAAAKEFEVCRKRGVVHDAEHDAAAETTQELLQDGDFEHAEINARRVGPGENDVILDEDAAVNRPDDVPDSSDEKEGSARLVKDTFSHKNRRMAAGTQRKSMRRKRAKARM